MKNIEANEAEEVLKVYHSCVCQHQKKGFNQWDENYPNLPIVLNDIKNKWLFGGYVANKLVAVIAITEDEPIEYQTVKWSLDSAPYYIIHRLCVAESWLRKGYAKQLMSFAEDYANLKGRKSIRLDTYSLNEGALLFYKKIGYRKTGVVNFPKKTASNYTCFEKLL
ncbi:MAG: GNAT family N-acetyltransferase [Flavobacteriales bacterium]|nr:GNAT family N-acetyltransferase [Flavobacteriales bacterium]